MDQFDCSKIFSGLDNRRSSQIFMSMFETFTGDYTYILVSPAHFL